MATDEAAKEPAMVDLSEDPAFEGKGLNGTVLKQKLEEWHRSHPNEYIDMLDVSGVADDQHRNRPGGLWDWPDCLNGDALPRLRVLILSGAGLRLAADTAARAGRLAALTSLEELDLSRNPGVSSGGLSRTVTLWPLLKHLHVSDCALSAEWLTSARLPQLRVFWLEVHNREWNPSTVDVVPLDHVEEVFAAGSTRLTAGAVAGLTARFPAAHTLDLSDCATLERLPLALADLPLSDATEDGSAAGADLAPDCHGLNVAGCDSLVDPPPAVVEAGTAAVLQYLRDLREGVKSASVRPMAPRLVKVMLAGDGGAGKSSLLREMMAWDMAPASTGAGAGSGSGAGAGVGAGGGPSAMPAAATVPRPSPTAERPSTVGIDVRLWEPSGKSQHRSVVPPAAEAVPPVALLVYDAAGQSRYQSTHTYFMGGETLYVFVVDVRWPAARRQASARRWLRMIHARSGACRVMVVGTHADVVDGRKRAAEKVVREVCQCVTHVGEELRKRLRLASSPIHLVGVGTGGGCLTVGRHRRVGRVAKAVVAACCDASAFPAAHTARPGAYVMLARAVLGRWPEHVRVRQRPALTGAAPFDAEPGGYGLFDRPSTPPPPTGTQLRVWADVPPHPELEAAPELEHVARRGWMSWLEWRRLCGAAGVGEASLVAASATLVGLGVIVLSKALSSATAESGPTVFVSPQLVVDVTKRLVRVTNSITPGVGEDVVSWSGYDSTRAGVAWEDGVYDAEDCAEESRQLYETGVLCESLLRRVLWHGLPREVQTALVQLLVEMQLMVCLESDPYEEEGRWLVPAYLDKGSSGGSLPLLPRSTDVASGLALLTPSIASSVRTGKRREMCTCNGQARHRVPATGLLPVPAAGAGGLPAVASSSSRRVALCIGNALYDGTVYPPIFQCSEDCMDIAARLAGLGFTHGVRRIDTGLGFAVLPCQRGGAWLANLTTRELEDAFEALGRGLADDDVVFVFYSGHGIKKEHDWLCGVDGQHVAVNTLMARLADFTVDARAHVVLVLNCCRTPPSSEWDEPSLELSGFTPQDCRFNASREGQAVPARSATTSRDDTRGMTPFAFTLAKFLTQAYATFTVKQLLWHVDSAWSETAALAAPSWTESVTLASPADSVPPPLCYFRRFRMDVVPEGFLPALRTLWGQVARDHEVQARMRMMGRQTMLVPDSEATAHPSRFVQVTVEVRVASHGRRGRSKPRAADASASGRRWLDECTEVTVAAWSPDADDGEVVALFESVLDSIRNVPRTQHWHQLVMDEVVPCPLCVLSAEAAHATEAAVATDDEGEGGTATDGEGCACGESCPRLRVGEVKYATVTRALESGAGRPPSRVAGGDRGRAAHPQRGSRSRG